MSTRGSYAPPGPAVQPPTGSEAELERTIPPDDPLVLKPCFGGCLCVAAWGEEAAALNRLTTELGI